MITIDTETLAALLHEAILRYEALIKTFVGDAGAANLAVDATVESFMTAIDD